MGERRSLFLLLIGSLLLPVAVRALSRPSTSSQTDLAQVARSKPTVFKAVSFEREGPKARSISAWGNAPGTWADDLPRAESPPQELWNGPTALAYVRTSGIPGALPQADIGRAFGANFSSPGTSHSGGFQPHQNLPALAGSDLTAAISALQRRYAAVDNIRAEFVQTYRAPGVNQTESGIMMMKKPGLMRWEYKEPEVKLFVADGRETFLYVPEDRQVLIQRFTAEDLRSTPLQLLLGDGDIRKSFDVTWEMDPRIQVGGDLQLRLTPRVPQGEYAYVVIACDRTTFDLRRIVIRESGGNASEFVFRGMSTNVKIDAKQFQFKMPKGVEVVRVDAK